MIEYEYVVKNQLYRCKKICVGGELNPSDVGRAKVRLRRYPLGEEVRVYFCPSYPAFACLEQRAEGSWLLVLIGTIFFVGGIGYVIGYVG